MEGLIVTGSYDGKVAGFISRTETNGSEKLGQWFSHTPHLGCVKAIAISGKYLVSGSTDETIKIMNLAKKTEEGGLYHHQGAVTALQFVGKKHLLSGGADGQVCFWRTSDWELMHAMAGHKDGVSCMAVHPSGLLALTAGGDKTFKMWDLVKGVCAFRVKFAKVVDSVQWAPNGRSYATLMEHTITGYSVQDEKKEFDFRHGARIVCFQWLSDDVLCCGTDDKALIVVHTKSQKEIGRHAATARVKSLSILTVADVGDSRTAEVCCVTSDGHVFTVDIALTGAASASVKVIASVDTRNRFTCMATDVQFARAPSADAAGDASSDSESDESASTQSSDDESDENNVSGSSDSEQTTTTKTAPVAKKTKVVLSTGAPAKQTVTSQSKTTTTAKQIKKPVQKDVSAKVGEKRKK